MTNTGLNVPGGMGGIMRYDEEFDSKFKFSPAAVIAFLIAMVILVLSLRFIFPLPAV